MEEERARGWDPLHFYTLSPEQQRSFMALLLARASLHAPPSQQ